MTKTDLEEINATLEKDIIFLKEQFKTESGYEKVPAYDFRKLCNESRELELAKDDITDLKDTISEHQKIVYELAKALTTLINKTP